MAWLDNITPRKTLSIKHIWILLVWILVTLIQQDAHCHDFVVGIIIPRYHKPEVFAMRTSISAVDIALEDIEIDNILPANTSVRYVWRDTKASPVECVGLTLELRNMGADVIIGPPGSSCTIPVKYMTEFWNMPHISWASTDSSLSQKSSSTTLIRTVGPFSNVGKYFALIFNEFKWSIGGMISLREGPCDFGASSIRADFTNSNITLREDILVDNDMEIDVINSYLHQLQRNVRIIIVCMTTEDLHNFLLAAVDNQMTGGDYVYITVNSLPKDVVEPPWVGRDREDDLREAYRSVYDVTLGSDPDNNIESFKKEVIERMSKPPWNETIKPGEKAASYSPYLYDAIYLYAKMINQTVREGLNMSDGRLLFDLTANISYNSSITGEVEFDGKGDRKPIYLLWDYNNDKEGLIPQTIAVGKTTKNTGQIFRILLTPRWNTPDGNPPPDTPLCGFRKEFCETDPAVNNIIIIVSITCLVVVLTVVIVAVQLIRKRQFEKQLSMMLWRVNYKHIEFGNHKKGQGSGMALMLIMIINARSAKCCNVKKLEIKRLVSEAWTSFGSGVSSRSKTGSLIAGNQMFINVGTYKGNLVAIKNIRKDSVPETRENLIHLKQMIELKQENVNPFIGACIDPPHICLLYLYCSKGSLQDILENDDIKLDWVFKYSLVSDIVSGMAYLHSSSFKSHGHLKSTNCVVDSRWLLKITDYGLKNVLVGQTARADEGEYEKYRGMLWTAPEFLRQDPRPPSGTQLGDVYSFGIILHEICYRSGVFGTEKLSPKEIIENVRKVTEPPFRPKLQDEESDVAGYLKVLMSSCWGEIPQRRPDFTVIKRTLKSHNKGNKGNIMDNMLKMMERYANNLEDLVEQRTQELVQEKRKTDKLLYRLLPPVVAEKLKKGAIVDPELFEHVTIYFSDIVGFTNISAQSTPMEVVDLLNQLYTLFDDIIALHDVYKVETIGDAYMVVSGVPMKNGNRHAGAIADMALDILSALMDFTVPHMPEKKLQIRIGVHSGACCAGVVGLTMPRYCLFGDTVNTASRMESNGEGQRIHISQVTFTGLQKLGGYITCLRGDISIKGKGIMQTYWLNGKEGYTKQLPDACNNQYNPSPEEKKDCENALRKALSIDTGV